MLQKYMIFIVNSNSRMGGSSTSVMRLRRSDDAVQEVRFCYRITPHFEYVAEQAAGVSEDLRPCADR